MLKCVRVPTTSFLIGGAKMSVVTEIIRLESDRTLSFGNYAVKEKQKFEDFEAMGDIYKVKTHNQVTRLEKNGRLMLETVPGAAIFNFKAAENAVSFGVTGFGYTNITTELESETGYKIIVDGAVRGEMRSNVGGKITFSVDLNESQQQVRIEKHPIM